MSDPPPPPRPDPVALENAPTAEEVLARQNAPPPAPVATQDPPQGDPPKSGAEAVQPTGKPVETQSPPPTEALKPAPGHVPQGGGLSSLPVSGIGSINQPVGHTVSQQVPPAPTKQVPTAVPFGAFMSVEYMRKYSVDVQATTKVTAKLRAVPPPAAFNALIDAWARKR